ncbi:rhodanese-like domain-containing protein [Kiloniella antarctica]|uniref:Rhodanese-like domain-containing protein n=1 Tax=Kiloniella antarctica TaxID=1550907 RepID=A0ABW5BFR1_9PROT
MPSAVALVRAAKPEEALAHFERRLRLEADCWDTHYALTEQIQDFVLLDVRSPDLYNQGHIPKAINLPHGKIIARKMREYPDDTLFVVYCAGPHCNGANKAAVRLAKLGYQVKELIGGVEGWKDEGFKLAVTP